MKARATISWAAMALAALTAGPAAFAEGRPAGSKLVLVPVVRAALRHDTSPPLRSIRPRLPVTPFAEPAPNRKLRGASGAVATPHDAAATASEAAYSNLSAMPSPLVAFEGVSNRDGRVPPDTNGDVGPGHVMQWVNISLAVWDRAGTLLLGPVNGRTLWAGFGGICEQKDNGDPVVLYDALADRWLASQLAFTMPNDFHQCVAVSQSGDPTGAWHRYDFLVSSTKLNDYPKFGVWPDAYYLAVNQFDGSTQAYRGQGAIAFERDKMLAGAAARMVQFDLESVNPNYGGQLPSHLAGPLAPPAGSPNYFVEVDDGAWGFPSDRLSIWKFHVDWADPSRSTFGVAGEPNSVIDLTAAGHPFDSDLCGYASNCIPQPAPGTAVDAISDRLMYRLAYRNFGTHESIVVNHSVDVDGTNHAGIRWYEIRSPGAPAPVLHQAGTLAPDADHRWMASAAMDGRENLAVGYSVSGATTYPSIRYAGRFASDPVGTLPRSEAALMSGSGAQTGAYRWGDYSSLSVDPTDDCTFWYTQEYYASSSSYGWQTRIGSFRFEGCRPCPLAGIPTLTVDREASGVRLGWTASAYASAYDALEGGLSTLRVGGIAASVRRCLADGTPERTLLVDAPDPAPGDGDWYLVRGVIGLCQGTWEESAPAGSVARDAAIAATAGVCP